MQLGKRSRRVVAATLLTILLTNTVAPTVTYALTSGPTAPEATSFEPVDTTDMVNLQTGDFTYNIPLLEVPGPEGGYPLSLSYHAGIQPNEDASWVGLGWTLNPGAITRNVNGYPDDWANPSGISQVYWSGTSGTYYQVGVSIGIANTPATVTFGLSFSQDQYQGFSGSLFLGAGARLGPISAGVSMGQGGLSGGLGFSHGPASVGLSASEAGVALNGQIGGSLGLYSAAASFSTNFSSLSVGFTGGFSILQASMNTKSGFSVLGGYSGVFSSTAEPAIQTEKSGFGFDIPIISGVSLSLGWGKYRQWIDKTTNVVIHGSMHATGWPLGDDIAYDTYSLLENPSDKNIVDYADPTILQGGAYLDFDVYNVSAQGLGGAIRPYQFQGEVLGQNRKSSSNAALVTYHSPGGTFLTPKFRFVGDFSNSYRQPYNNYSTGVSNLLTALPPFDAPSFGEQNDAYGYNSGQLAGSRYVEVGVKVRPLNTRGYFESDRYKPGMINGFSITNESGVTYHYGLPAYSFGEHLYQEKVRIGGAGPLNYNKNTRNEPYAYTWYLTSITGPDFVDRDGDGGAGVNDWGYWVNFDYGKWSNNYVWRNPAVGFLTDDDNNFQNVSMGTKEVYYLNAIRTRSHVALFEKDIRMDGKSAAPADAAFNAEPSSNTANPPGVYNVNSRQSLRLNKIYLLNAADANTVLPFSGNSNAYKPVAPRYITCSDCELAVNVLDKTDVDAVGRAVLEAKSLRIIDMEYDYSLCSGVTNSFDINNPAVKLGKLTLNKIFTRGKGGVSLLPPMKFEYELGLGEVKSENVTFNFYQFTTTNGTFEIGDLLIYEGTPDVYGGPIITKSVSSNTYTYEVLGSMPLSGQASIRTTKNPPFRQEYYDLWGMFRADGSTISNPNLARRTTYRTNRAVDAWCLRKIITPLGSEIKIEYESDTYKSSTFNTNQAILLFYLNGTVTSNTITFESLAEGGVLDYLKVGDQVNFVAYQGGSITVPSTVTRFMARALDSRSFVSPVYVDAIDPGLRVTLRCDDFNNALFNDKTGFVYSDNGNPIPTCCGITYSINAPAYLNLSVKKADNIPGGGIRVKSISSINSADGRISKTNYDYRVPGTNQTSGITSYEPGGLDKTWYDAPYNKTGTASVVAAYRKAVYKDLNSLYSIARELPPPGVMYEYVTVSSSIKNADEQNERSIEGKTQYQFEVFRDNYVGRQYLPGWTSGSNRTANLVLKKFNSAIGQPRSIIQFDNNGKKIGETQYHYLHDGIEHLPFDQFMDQYKARLAAYNYQGFLQERYSEVKQVSNQPNAADNGVLATTSAREEYPCIQTGQTAINYVNGARVVSQVLGFDFFSGAVTKSVSTDSYGNRFMTEVIPAYRLPGSLHMGVLSPGNFHLKNMLTQAAETRVFKVDANNVPLGLVSAEATQWTSTRNVLDMNGNAVVQNNRFTTGEVYRIGATYSWMPINRNSDGITPIAEFSGFDFNNPDASAGAWKKTTEVTLYDVYSKSLEANDFNENSAAIRMNYGSNRVELNGSQTNYYEIAYSGAEDASINQTSSQFVRKVDGVVVTNPAAAHTGASGLRLEAPGDAGFVYSVSTDKLNPTRKYIASVWVKPVSGTASDVKLYANYDGTPIATSQSSGVSTKVAGSWRLINLVIENVPIGGTLVVGCRNDASVAVYVDDMRFQPLNAATTAYVYNPFSGELDYILDNHNLYTRFEYDAAGRLIKTYKEKVGVGEFKINEYQYSLGN